VTKKTSRKTPGRAPKKASKRTVDKIGGKPHVRFSDRLTASLEEISNIIEENKTTLDAIQDIALEVTRTAGVLGTAAARYARMVDSVLDTAVPILSNIPLVNQRTLDLIIDLQELANDILKVCTAADKVIPDLEEGLLNADVVKLQAHTGDLEKMTAALQRVLPASSN
jgi:uncharacterized protein Yka (UPF0111/DUF47 family)